MSFHSPLLDVLLTNADIGLSSSTRADLESGHVDGRLVQALATLAQSHGFDVTTIKTGHPMGAYSPAGKENTHFFYRAADIIAVNGRPIESNGADPVILAFGRSLRVHVRWQRRRGLGETQ